MSMKKEQVDRAFELAETWINGNRSDVIQALENACKLDPIIGIAIAFQISAALGTFETEFQNSIDRIAGDRYPRSQELPIDLW